MLSKVFTTAIMGVDGQIITVETDINTGGYSFNMVGLADMAVREAKERISAALKNNGFSYPKGKILINLAPADFRKEGSHYDLSLAIGLIISSNQMLPIEDTYKYVFIGELSLDGELKPVNGILPMIITSYQSGYSKFIVPKQNEIEAALAGVGEIYGARNLREVINHICTSDKKIPKVVINENLEFYCQNNFDLDFSDIKGQVVVKRAMEIAAAGSHNMLMIGPPGSGKTMLAKRFPTILPSMTKEESLEVTKIYSVAGLIKRDKPLVTTRPFRSPHHTISPIALIGGGRIPRPGEVSLSHRGVLFLDEFAEFEKSSLEVMRQPIEDKSVSISRIMASINYPASFMLLAGMNPCPCGYYNDPNNECHCTQAMIDKYLKKISGPLLDRIDLITQVSVESYDNLNMSSKDIETSEQIRSRVNKARDIQLERYKEMDIYFNSALSTSQLEIYCKLDNQTNNLMKNAFDRYNMSARSYHRILKLSRTIADLEGSENIELHHLSEALQYRNLDKKYLA